MSTWQLCPKCNGKGEVRFDFATTWENVKCDVCDGMKIISVITGLPPKGQPNAATQKNNLPQ